MRARYALVLGLCQLVLAELNVPELLVKEKSTGRGGVRARLSAKGVQYVAEVLTGALLTEVVTSQAPAAAPQELRTADANLTLADMKLQARSSSHRLESSMEQPNLIHLRISDLNLSSTFEVQREDEMLGKATLSAPSTEVLLAVEPTRTASGAPNLKLHKCTVQAANLTADLEPVVPEAAEQLRPALEAEALALFEGLLCSRVDFVVQERVNERFGLLTPKITLAHINDDELVKDLVERIRLRRQRRGQPWGWGAGMNLPMGMQLGAGLGRKRRDVIRSFNVSHMDTLFLDYTILRDLRVTSQGLEIESSGEVSLRGRGGTPFGPVPAPLPEAVHEDSMLQMIVSDFMPNSLMYHGHTIGLFKTKVDPSTPHFGAIMRSTCSLSSGLLFCLGDLFPTLRRTHPDRRLALLFNTLQAPVILFRPASAGGIAFSLLGRLAVLVIDPATKAEQQVAEMRIEVAAQMKMRLSSSMVRPKISLEKIKLSTLSPGILLQSELDDAVLLAREVLQRMVNDLLKDGIPIPVHPLFKLVKPKVKVVDRALLLQTNFELNERLMRQLTAGDLERRRRL